MKKSRYKSRQERRGKKKTTNREKEIKQRQSRDRDTVQSGVWTNGLHLNLKSRLCLDVIYPDYIYTRECSVSGARGEITVSLIKQIPTHGLLLYLCFVYSAQLNFNLMWPNVVPTIGGRLWQLWPKRILSEPRPHSPPRFVCVDIHVGRTSQEPNGTTRCKQRLNKLLRLWGRIPKGALSHVSIQVSYWMTKKYVYIIQQSQSMIMDRWLIKNPKLC